ADFRVALCAAVHDGGGPRQRIRRGHRRALPARAGRDWPGALHRDADHQCHLARVHLVHGPSEAAETGAEHRPGRERRMTRDRWRRAVSHAILLLCGLSVLIALVPLALVLFYVLTQGVTSLS